jgi:hypothetical protein
MIDILTFTTLLVPLYRVTTFIEDVDIPETYRLKKINTST